MAMVKRFGKDGLKVKFTDASGAHPNAYSQAGQGSSLGDNHRVEVLIGDNIREFKAKLTLACFREDQFWKGRNNDDHAARYADIRIGFRHLVMVFVPSVKVQKLYAQKLHEGEEYKRAYKQAMEDPSNWQPLDPSRSFAQYTQFSFGRSQQPTLLRVVEQSEAYKAQNLRYKLYDEEMNKRIWQDTNERAKCAGWARYQHEADQSIEWRPAFISRASEDGSKQFEAKWVFEPSKLVVDKKTNKPNAPLVEEEQSRQMKERIDVLLGPRIPKFEDEVHEEHEDLLAQAKMLRSSGKSDWDIEAILNKLLTDRWEEKKRSAPALAERPPPPPITVDVIRLYLQRKEAQEVEKADKHTHATKAAMMSGSTKPGGTG